jgi:hypothetical protein
MKKRIVLGFLLAMVLTVFSQNLQSEYRYLTLVKTQQKKLIYDNLRNAEIVADSLLFSKTLDKKTASLFLMELGNNYSALKKAEFALFSFLRQRFCFPTDTISLFVEKQMRFNALLLNIDKQMIEFIIQKSAVYNLSDNKEENLNKLIYWASKIETKDLNPLLLHHLDLMNAKGYSLIDDVLKWEDLTRISFPIKHKAFFLAHDFDSLDFAHQKRYYKYQTCYLLKNKAWNRAKDTLFTFRNLAETKKSNLCFLRFRSEMHF